MVYDDVTGSESSVICEFSYGKYCESNKAVLKDYITAITKTLINDLDFGFITTTILSGHEKQTNNTEVAQ
jgi:ribosomal protein S17E